MNHPSNVRGASAAPLYSWTATIRRAVRPTALALSVGLVVGCSPEGRIAESSKTKECSAELVGGLEAFARDLGLAYKVSPSDADELFKNGTVEKQYARDGVQLTLGFGIDKSDKGCSLKFYKRKESQPGHMTSSTGNYGTVALTACKCAEGK